ncbi:CpsD/CapB family tyrosine-protein kinase [Jeotgalibacillus aurantiacus]|uniref:CpsD/CapB family tyrosine-protein kinase n=1 Tax=Jeotgalibacillus aurantiacus TaxID=2763266 RepID=UPI001D0A13B0|nr:CpsD/CapB family tyrosine-protein kinase [Jeotgalibacillus aurantiacus]
MKLRKRQQTTADKKRSVYTYTHPDSALADEFHTIRTNIKFLMTDQPMKIFVLTSSTKGEGKSTAAVNLATLLSQQKERVLLIDANLRKPVIHQYFHLDNHHGLTTVLKSRRSLAEVMHKGEISRLDILTSGPDEYNPAELLGSEQMKQLLDKVSKEYDAIIIDAPNVLDYTETRILTNLADGVLLVVRRGKVIFQDALEVKRILNLAHANVIGAIMNER